MFGKFCVPAAEGMDEAGTMIVDEFVKQFQSVFGDVNVASYVADINAA